MYVLKLNEENRILSVCYENEHIPADLPRVEEVPAGNLYDYKYENGTFIYDPLPEPEPVPETPTQIETIEAQVLYTAMMTDTLLEV